MKPRQNLESMSTFRALRQLSSGAYKNALTQRVQVVSSSSLRGFSTFPSRASALRVMSKPVHSALRTRGFSQTLRACGAGSSEHHMTRTSVQIIGWLTPLELLSLARTSKTLRSFLMRRSSASLWKAARLNVEDLPPCPSDLVEPAYASLMYDTHCGVSQSV